MDRPKSLGFPHAANGPPFFVVPRDGYHRFPATTEGFDAKDGVGAGNVRRAWGGLFVRFCRVGDHSGAGPLITPRLKKLPVADLAPVAHGGGPGSAVLTGAGARLAAAAIGTAPGGISRLFGNLVSRCKAEGLPIATASASAGTSFRLKALWAIR